uniref:Uncharacterized protein n=2 Tax=Spongospora subterranea TaxID=70186 RepID=A0A0H5QP00_9EUKA|eukprot:CRZ03121.1 hypothetical protein [Spongospora subterranea]
MRSNRYSIVLYNCVLSLDVHLRESNSRPDALEFLSGFMHSPDVYGNRFEDSYVIGVAAQAANTGCAEVIRAMIEEDDRIAKHYLVIDCALGWTSLEVLACILDHTDLSVPSRLVQSNNVYMWSLHDCNDDAGLLADASADPRIEAYLVERLPWLADMWAVTGCKCIPDENIAIYRSCQEC